MFPYLQKYSEATIIFGADVTHPEKSVQSPSIAAVVATCEWPLFSTYRVVVLGQQSSQEIITRLGELVKAQLYSFYKSTNHQKPDRIVFYSDGVGDSQFGDALSVEVDAIRQACKQLEDVYNPYITFVVVKKRHHT